MSEWIPKNIKVRLYEEYFFQIMKTTIFLQLKVKNIKIKQNIVRLI